MQQKIKNLWGKLIARKEVRYFIAGGASEAIEYFSFLILFAATHLLYASNSISYILGVVSGFTLHKTWTFRGQHQLKTSHQFAGYAAVATINFFVINIAVGFLVYGLNVKPFIAKFVSIGIAAVWAFLLSNFVFFRLKKTETD